MTQTETMWAIRARSYCGECYLYTGTYLTRADAIRENDRIMREPGHYKRNRKKGRMLAVKVLMTYEVPDAD